MCQLRIESDSFASRFRRGFQLLILFWVGAFVCIFIPVLHFILVPTGILLGFFMFYREMGFQYRLVSGIIECPGCRQSYNVRPLGFNWPKYERCRCCDADLILEATADAES